ncbi:histidine--tRNA ligase [Saccharibacillus sp. O23]|uniref:histidine--tRNA ligase n=1 Tax=Saccharibacillus sp. O23 TaxID=2009338 RepID=UPI000B4DF2A5|nr:histidine--tRNA ligase [Saccharibacillus sp. O23]OWR31980.1 histidine--tRNA ligase [Saccharibacillus sp. O23]
MQNVKGTYDFFGNEQAIRRKVENTLRTLFELYDFDEMSSTILNELDLLTSKYAGGDEIVKEMYRLTDQGERRLGLRYDLTIPFAKVIALNPGIELPYKRYEIGKVFRDGPVKKGRLREFLQCDADVVGVAGPEAEAELMQLAAEAFRRLELPVVIRWNNRRFLGELLAAIGVPEERRNAVILTLDKIAKIGREEVRRELSDQGLETEIVGGVLRLLDLGEADRGVEALAERYDLPGGGGAGEVRALGRLLEALGLNGICRFDPFLARGLSFYTGTVYEIFDASGEFASSLGGGGRYDSIIGQLVGREDLPYPTVGLSFGMESIMAMLAKREIDLPQPQALVIPIFGATAPALAAAGLLRAGGVRTSVELSGRKLKKSLAGAAARGIRYVILVGEDEAAAGQVRLKDMDRQTEEALTAEEALTRIGGRIEQTACE